MLPRVERQRRLQSQKIVRERNRRRFKEDGIRKRDRRLKKGGIRKRDRRLKKDGIRKT